MVLIGDNVMSMASEYCERAQDEFHETYDEIHGEGALELLEQDVGRYNMELEAFESEYMDNLLGKLIDETMATHGGS